MKCTRKVSFETVHVEFVPKNLEPNKLYVSLKYKTSSHLCFCGCGNLVVTPLGPGWWSLIESNGLSTMNPSILSSQLSCRSHYVIRDSVAKFLEK